jgi:hypothetical protein
VAAAFVLPPVERNTHDDAAAVGIVIDSRFVKAGAGTDAAVETSDAVRAVISQTPPRRLSVSLSGDSPALLVPPTADAQGALVVMDGSAILEASAAASGAGQRNRSQIDLGAERIVYVTSQHPDDVETAARDIRSHNREVAYVVVTGSGALFFGTYDQSGSLSWSPGPLALHEFLASEKFAETYRWSWLQSLSAVQRLALMGFGFVAALCLWSRFRP